MIAGLITVLVAYLLGSINFAVIFSRVFMERDIREVGSGNAGSTNMLRSAGILPGLLTFVCDALKGWVACYIGKVVFEILCWRLSLDDAPWSSKPVEVDSSQIETLIENNQCYTTQEIANIPKISKSRVENHLQQLGHVHQFDVWIPYK